MEYQLLVLSLVSGLVAGKLQELSWVMDMNHISYLPYFGAPDLLYKYEYVFAGDIGPTFLAYNKYSTVEHMGTHVDAPYHTYKPGRTIDEIPLEDLIGPLVKIDIRDRAETERNANLLLEDLLSWEEKFGQIPERAFVVMYSGWDQYYGDNTLYVGTNKTLEEGGAEEMSFPGISGIAAQWLVMNRNIRGMAVDVGSCDSGNATDGPAHSALLPADRLCIENLRDLGTVPECGAKFYALPVMLKNGTGSQARVFAEWIAGEGFETTCNGLYPDIWIFSTSHSNQASLNITASLLCFAIFTLLM